MLIAAGIVLVLALLLASPVTVKVLYENEWAVTVRYLFLRFAFSLQKRNLPEKRKNRTRKKRKTRGRNPKKMKKSRDSGDTEREGSGDRPEPPGGSL